MELIQENDVLKTELAELKSDPDHSDSSQQREADLQTADSAALSETEAPSGNEIVCFMSRRRAYVFHHSFLRRAGKRFQPEIAGGETRSPHAIAR